MATSHQLSVGPLPAWLDAARFLGLSAAGLSSTPEGQQRWVGALSRPEAADVQARLRGLGFDGQAVHVQVQPLLSRSAVRAARTADARRRREVTPGFADQRARWDEEGRFSLTPDVLALWMGQAAQKRRVVDACCGVGGNTIGFARAGCEVVAIERDPRRLALAKHNAAVYGVQDRVRFLLGDACTLLPALKTELVFLDPPWGGAFDRVRMELKDLPLLMPLLAAVQHVPEVWLKLPPSFDCRQLPWARPMAVFGRAAGDYRRVKFLWLRGQP